jgi:hypothetical protein
MTKPVYFPHTYLSPETAAAIRSAFSSVVGYQPVAGRRPPDMQELVESGFLEIVAPAPDDEERLDRVIQELERWGRLQQGGAGLLAVFFSNRPDSDPLMADGTTAQIASEIRRPPSDALPAAQEALMRSAVFLQLAHQVDRQSYQVHAELKGCGHAYAELLDALAGEDARPPQAPVAPPAGPLLPERDSLLEHRLRAWSRLFLHRPAAGPVFVTACPDVAGLIAEQFPSLCRIGRSALDKTTHADAASAPPDAGGLMARLEMLACLPLPDASVSDKSGNDDPLIYAVPDVSPLRLFARLAQSEEAPEADASAPKWRHTLVVDFSRRIPQ